jgi:3-hydroxyacyl-[acyl-carrier-protein] dehydratase
MTNNEIIAHLPYGTKFLFVDAIEEVSETRIVGQYQFKEDEYFYASHFKENPITPGVILIECMAQIGLVCLGIYLVSKTDKNGLTAKNNVALSSSEIDFLISVYPKEKVTVVSEIVYFRFNKLKCKVKMLNSKSELVCKGTLSGMLI